MNLLIIEHLTKHFGGVAAVDNLDVEVQEREIMGLIGPNGAGKSTLFAVIAGFDQPDSGRVIFQGRDITGMRADSIAHLGLVRTFQMVKPIADMTVLENTMVGAMMRFRAINKARQRAYEILDLVGLAAKAHFEIRQLTIGDKKRLEVARAMATDPKVLLLDEVMAGLNQSEILQAVQLIKKINESGVTLLIVEHVMEVIMPLSHRVVVLDHGRKIAEGLPEQVAHNPEVIRAYLGERKAKKMGGDPNA